MSKAVSYLPFSNKETAECNCGFLLMMLLLVEAVTFLLSFYFSLQFVLFLASIFIVGIVFTFSVERTLILLLSLIIIFQGPRYKSDAIPFVITPKIITGLIAAIFLFWILSIFLSGRTKLKSSSLSSLMAVFLGMALVASFIGIINNAGPTIIVRELVTFFYFIVFFVVIDQVKNSKSIRRIIATILIAAVIASLEYIFFFLSGEITLAAMGRIVTGQIHVVYLALSFLISFLLWHMRKRRILVVLSLIPIITALLISQTRGTWLITIIAVTSTTILFLADKKKIHLIRILGYVLLAAAFLFLGIYLTTGLLSRTSLGFVVETRARTMLSVGKDPSILMRIAQNWAVWERIKASPFFGNGLGSILHINPWYKVNWVDNTYFQVLWKFGIIGLLIYLSILVLVLKKSLFIYRNTKNDFYKSFAVGMFSTFLGFIVLGFISPVLIKYRFNVVWAVLFGLIQVIEGFVKKETELQQIEV